MKKFFFCILASLIFFITFQSENSVGYASNHTLLFGEKRDVPIDKDFTFTFSKPLDPKTVNAENIYIKDQHGLTVDDITIYISGKKKNKIIVKAPAQGYKTNSTYTLYLNEGIYNKNNRGLSNPGKVIFHTSSSANFSNDFIPRTNSINEIVYQDSVIVLPPTTFASVGYATPQDDFYHFVAPDNALKQQLTTLEKDYIIIFPASENFPHGWAKKVTNIATNGNDITISTTEPTYEEVIADIDISQRISITEEDFTFTEDVEMRSISSKKKEHLITNPDGSLATLSVEKNPSSIEKGAKLVLKNYQVPLKNYTNFKLNGEITFKEPTVAIDTKWGSPHEIRFETGFDLNLNKDLSLDFKNNSDEKIYLPININAKILGVAGGEVKPFLSFDNEGNITLSSEIGIDSDVSIGLRKNDLDQWYSFNNSHITPYANILELKGELESELKFGFDIQVKVLQFQIGGFETSLSLEQKIKGEVSYHTSCYWLNGYSNIDGFAYVGDNDKPLVRFNLLNLEKDLYSTSNCHIKAIESEPLTIYAGETAKLDVVGITSKDEKYTFNLPDDNIQLQSGNPKIATVHEDGTVSAHASGSQHATTNIVITYENENGKEVNKSVKINVQEKEKAPYEVSYLVQFKDRKPSYDNQATIQFEAGADYAWYGGKTYENNIDVATQQTSIEFDNYHANDELILSYHKKPAKAPRSTNPNISITEVSEPALKWVNFEPGQKLLVTTKVAWPSSSGFKFKEMTNQPLVDAVSYNGDKFQPPFVYYNNEAFTGLGIDSSSEAIIENVDTRSTLLYGSYRFIQFQETSEPALKKYIIKPNETVKITHLEPTMADLSGVSSLLISPLSKSGRAYIHMVEKNSTIDYYSGLEEFDNLEQSYRHINLYKGGYTTIKNEGNSDLLLSHPFRPNFLIQ